MKTAHTLNLHSINFKYKKIIALIIYWISMNAKIIP